MTQEHPIAPPSEDHVLKWSDEWFEAKVKHMTREKHLCMQAARWGADQELEACCADIHTIHGQHRADWLRWMRRPKTPSLKEQALEVLNEIESGKHGWLRVFDKLNTIRRALEQLDDH